jgi:drug/metabolite transporter (DMT)-like permease
MLGTLLGIHVLLFTWSVKLTSILNATILVNTTPVWAMIIGYVLTRRLPRPIAIVGTFSAIGGVAVIGAAQAAYSPGRLLGDLLALLAAVVWGIYLMAGGSALRGQSPIVLLPGIYGGASVSVLLLILLNGEPLELPSRLELAPLIGISLFPTALGHSLQFSALKGLTPHGAATLALLEPAVATTLGALFFGEIPRLEFLVGAVLTTVGIYIVISRRE